MNKNVCECCGSVIVPGKKVCPICGSKLDWDLETNREPSQETQILPNLDDLIKEMSAEPKEAQEEDLDFDMPEALKIKTQPKPMAAPPAEPVVPVDPDLPDYFKDMDSEEDDDAEDEDLEEERAQAVKFPEAETEQDDEDDEDDDEDDEEVYHIPAAPVMNRPARKPETAPKEDPDLKMQKVQKVQREEQKAPKAQKAQKKEPRPAAGGKDKAICAVLAAVVVLLGIYIAFRFVQPRLHSGSNENKETTAATLPTPTITADKVLTLPVQGEGRFLTVRLEPENKDYQVTYESADPSIATVTADGWVTAVAEGKTTVTITCQGVVAVSEIHCDFTPGAADQTTKPDASDPGKPGSTEPTDNAEPGETTQPGNPDIKKLELSHSDVTMFEKGEFVQLKVEGLSASQVTWSSDDPSVAEVKEGKVVAVGGGTTEIHAQYNGMEAVCIVRCSMKEENGGSSSEELTLSHTDVTMQQGESFSLRLRDSDGNAVDVAWSQGNSSVCEISGNEITAVGTGYTEVTGTYNGKTYTCIVRVI